MTTIIERAGRLNANDAATLAQDVWGPLALVDYGDLIVDYQPHVPGLRLPIGANVAFRREIVSLLGGWRTHLGKVDNSLTFTRSCSQVSRSRTVTASSSSD